MFRDYTVYVVPIEIDQSVIEWLDQDTTREVSRHRAKADYRVLCKSKEIAIAHALEVFKYKNPKIVGEVTREPLHAVVLSSPTIDSLSVEKVNEPAQARTV